MQLRAIVTSLAAAIGLAGVATPARSQQAPAAAVFKSGADLVRLDVRVSDAEGRPITDLRPDEFVVIDDGVERPVVLFQHIARPPADLAEATARTVTSDISTNQEAPRGQLFVIVFDQAHIAAGNEQRARRAAEKFLRTHVRRGDRVAVFALPGPGPQIAFTPDVTKAVASLKQVRGTLERAGMGALGTMRVDEAYEITRGNQEVLTRVVSGLSAASNFTDAVGSVVQRQAGEDPNIFTRLVQEDARTIVNREDSASRQFLQRLADVVLGLREVDGRKSLILFSEGFFIDNLTRELEEVAAAAARSYSAVYALDLNTRDLDPRQISGSGGEQFTEIHGRLGPLATLASETDGLLVNYANAWMDRALARAADQTRDYYLVGFEPSAPALKDRAAYHRVKLRVARRGAYVSARSGYSLGAEATPADRRRGIDAAFRSPFPQQGLTVEYTTYQVHGDQAGRESVILSLAADLPVAGSTEGRADVVFAVRSVADGRVVASGTDTLPLPRTVDSGRTVGTSHYSVRFEVPPGEYVMRAVVREPGGLVGSADRHLVVRRLDSAAVTAGDLILAGADRGALPVRATAYRSQGLSGSLAVYGPPASLANVNVVVELMPAGGGRAITSIQADLRPVRADAVPPAREARVALPLEGIDPGRYVARAVVRHGNESVAELLREVQVVDGAPPAVDSMPTEARSGPRRLDIASGDLAHRYLAAIASEAAEPVRRATRHASDREWKEAVDALGDDRSPSSESVRGLALLALGECDLAAAAFERRLTAVPRDATGAFFLGWSHAEAGRMPDAIGAWRNAVYIDPRLVPAHLALIDAYLELSQPSLAMQVVRAGLAALPDSPELRGRLAELERHR